MLHNINVLEKILVHKRMITFRMVLRKVHILIHVKSNDILKRNASILVCLNKSLIHSNRRRSSGKT